MKKAFAGALVLVLLAVAAVSVLTDGQTQDQLALRAQGMDY